VLENDGNVRLVSTGQVHIQPVSHASVDITGERGLLGIAGMNSKNSSSSSSSTNNSNSNSKVVFLYYTEPPGGELRNKVYIYQWNGQSLINPKLILDLSALPGPNHNAGKLAIGPDNYLYAIIGELRHNGKLQNIEDGPDPDDKV
jgi:aldose sugar dehydrogenase